MINREAKLKSQTEITRPLTNLALIISIMIILQNDISAEQIKYAILIPVMLYACYEDAITKKVTRSIHILIIIIGCIGITPVYLQSEAVLGLLFAPLPFLLTDIVSRVIIHKQIIGKGDIFFIASVGFAVGWSIVIPGLLIGLGVSIVYVNLKKTKEQTIAFIPIITIGILISVILNYQ